MVTNLKVSIRSADSKDRQQLANLIHFETQVHRHLDWRPPLEWIEHDPCLVAEANNQILAALVCPPDPPEAAWIRLFAVSSQWSEREAWQVLWPAARASLEGLKPVQAAAIPLQHWFQKLLGESGFKLAHDVVLLLWQPGRKRPAREAGPVNIRPMNFDDLPAVIEIDSVSFDSLWRNSLESIQMAYQQSAVATIAEDETGPIGYQISTSNPLGAHLARLAVRPDHQRQGVGYRILDDLLDQFERRGVTRATVNTQHDNQVSLALYKKAGFEITGESFPVMHFDIV